MPRSGRDPATEKERRASEDFTEVLSLMERALGMIDRQDGPHDVGAHLDLAIQRLKDWIELKDR